MMVQRVYAKVMCRILISKILMLRSLLSIAQPLAQIQHSSHNMPQQSFPFLLQQHDQINMAPPNHPHNNQFQQRQLLNSHLPVILSDPAADTAVHIPPSAQLLPPSALPILQQQQPPQQQQQPTIVRQRIYSAIFNQKGLKGTIFFRQPNSISGINIVVHLHSSPDIHSIRWEIHEFPVDWTENPLCSDLGLIAPNGDLTSRHGLLSTNGRSEFQDSLLQLGSIESIWMRSVVLIAANGDRVCATIRAPDDDPLIMVAVVNGRVSGEIVFMQPYSTTAGLADSGVGIHLRVLTNLFYTDGSAVRSQLAWDLRSSNEPRGLVSPSHIVDCSRLTTRTTDLNRILGPAPVGERRSSARISISSEVLALRTLASSSLASSNLGNLYVVIHDTSPPGTSSRQLQSSTLGGSTTGMAISCGYLQEIRPKQVRAVFAMHGVSGSITFTQNSRWDSTRIDAQLAGIRGVAGQYHVHEWPIEPIDPANVQDTVNVCNAPFTGQHYNPHGIDILASPAPGQGTHDQYQVGDLGGKHGLLSGAVAFSGTFFDDNLPLSGPLSIIGRSVVLHAQQTGERFVCADIGYPTRTTNAVARFDFPLKGQIIFRQPVDDTFADTIVLVSLQYVPNVQFQAAPQIAQSGADVALPQRRQQRQVLATAPATTNGRFLLGSTEHNWGIHWSSISTFDQQQAPPAANGPCASAGSIMNPFFIDAQHPQYDEQCSRAVPLRCQMGDLAAKLGRIVVAGTADLPTKSLFTDAQLPLTGPIGIIGRSLVIMDSGNVAAGVGQTQRLSCSNITRF